MNNKSLRFFSEFHDRTVLFRAGRLIFTTYGVLVGGAFFAGLTASSAYVAAVGLQPAVFAQFLPLALVAVLLGSRAASVAADWRRVLADPLAALIRPGFFMHGGIAGGTVAALGYCWWTGMDPFVWCDALAFCMPIGEALCRIGCYVYGCCWGRPSEGPFGVCYTSPDAAVVREKSVHRGVRLHPAQLYATVAHGLQFALFLALLPSKPFDGFFAGLYLVTHPLLRLFLETFRDDHRGSVSGKLTHTQLYSYIQLFLGIACLAGSAFRQHNHPLEKGLADAVLTTLGQPAVLSAVLGSTFTVVLAFGLHFGRVGSWLAPTNKASPKFREA
ncbi:MAG TPA: prolipoprotein diacylglyceryl transferase family protein [Polyangiaceae bacterium]|jgi:phosphatidylglycerol:prolipoprotein diacylglycerol transferase